MVYHYYNIKGGYKKMISKNQQKLNSGFHAKSEPKEILEGIDLSGKTAIVTGGYSGIGLETTRALAEAGANVFVPARRVDDAIIDEANISKMDLADIGSIKEYTQEFINEIKSLSILINNAGIMACPEL